MFCGISAKISKTAGIFSFHFLKNENELFNLMIYIIDYWKIGNGIKNLLKISYQPINRV